MTLADYLKFFFALIFVVSLMGGLAFILKRYGFMQGGVAIGKSRRLKVLESCHIDAKHKAVIIGCDDKEHLVLLGTNGDTVINSDIEKPKETQ